MCLGFFPCVKANSIVQTKYTDCSPDTWTLIQIIIWHWKYFHQSFLCWYLLPMLFRCPTSPRDIAIILFAPFYKNIILVTSVPVDTPAPNRTSHHQAPACDNPDSKVHGVNMGPIWGRQDPGESHVGPMNWVKSSAFWLSAVMLQMSLSNAFYCHNKVSNQMSQKFVLGCPIDNKSGLFLVMI